MGKRIINTERWMDVTPLKGEIWKDIPNYEELYQVSNIGRVKSLCKSNVQKNRWNLPVKIFRSERILKPRKSRAGYIRVTLTKHGQHKSYFVHRLVGYSFIENPKNLPFINHKDEDKTNNQVENLEWCTAKYNSNYGTSIERTAQKNRENGDVVFQYGKDGTFIGSYKNAQEAKRILLLKSEHINECCKNFKSSNGYLWRREKDGYKYGENIEPFRNSRFVQVIQYSKDGRKVAKYDSVLEASQKTGIPQTSIYNAYRKNHFAYGFKFKIANSNEIIVE